MKRDTLPVTTVILHVETVPPKALVKVAGQARGTTPLDLTLTQSTTPVLLELELAGFETLRQQLVPEVNQRILVSLVGVPPTKLPLRREAKPAQRRAQPDAGFHRFD